MFEKRKYKYLMSAYFATILIIKVFNWEYNVIKFKILN